VTANGTLSMGGNTMFLNGGLLINAGQATWSANVLYMAVAGC